MATGLLSRKIDPKRLITHRVKLDKILVAYERSVRRRTRSRF